jgi:hypothetical protein
MKTTKDWEIFHSSDNFETFNELSDIEKRIHHLVDNKGLPNRTFIKIYYKENNLVIAYKHLKWVFMRNRFFIKPNYRTLATITPKRIYCDDITNTCNTLIDFFKLEPEYLPCNRAMLRAILNGKYEEYCKENALIIGYSKETIKLFVDDVEIFKERLGYIELRDLFDQARILNRKIKMSWSDRKIHDMHMKWTEEIQAFKTRNCSDNLIWKNIPELPHGVELLNSERRIAEEGTKMHHCIYTNYKHPLEYRNAIAFHVHGDNPYTVMFYKYYNEEWCFNQAYHAWNKSLSQEEKSEAISLLTYAIEIDISNRVSGSEPIISEFAF